MPLYYLTGKYTTKCLQGGGILDYFLSLITCIQSLQPDVFAFFMSLKSHSSPFSSLSLLVWIITIAFLYSPYISCHALFQFIQHRSGTVILKKDYSFGFSQILQIFSKNWKLCIITSKAFLDFLLYLSHLFWYPSPQMSFSHSSHISQLCYVFLH